MYVIFFSKLWGEGALERGWFMKKMIRPTNLNGEKETYLLGSVLDAVEVMIHSSKRSING